MTEFMPLDELQLWDRNYRKGDVDAIVRSITQFGFNQALRVWQGGVVVAGNHSLKALHALKASGWQPRGGGITEDWQIRIVDVSTLTKTEAEAFAIADNRTAELAENDPDQLVELLQELNADGMMEVTGYDLGELGKLLGELDEMDFDPMDEWVGMPEFEQEDAMPLSIKVNFETVEDRQSFAELIGQVINEGTKFVYYPKQKRQKELDYQVIDNES